MREIGLKTDDWITLADDILREGHQLRFRARGKSMRPFISDGDLVGVKPIESSPVKKGDILLYQSDGRMVVHRVVHICQQGGEIMICTQGDAMRIPDCEITLKQIYGRVVWVDKFGKRFSTGDWQWRSLSWIWLAAAPIRGILFLFGRVIKLPWSRR